MSPLRWSDGSSRAAAVVGTLRLCVDLNIWCAAFLSEMAGRPQTGSQLLAAAAIRGSCSLGPTSPVISWAMLTRLEKVLLDKLGVSHTDARGYIELIAKSASAPPAGNAPYMVLGGTGLVALHDEEDAGVLETAIAGRADILTTANFADFVNYRTEVLKPGRIAFHRTSEHEILLAHQDEMAGWIRSGEIVLP